MLMKKKNNSLPKGEGSADEAFSLLPKAAVFMYMVQLFMQAFVIYPKTISDIQFL